MSNVSSFNEASVSRFKPLNLESLDRQAREDALAVGSALSRLVEGHGHSVLVDLMGKNATSVGQANFVKGKNGLHITFELNDHCGLPEVKKWPRFNLAHGTMLPNVEVMKAPNGESFGFMSAKNPTVQILYKHYPVGVPQIVLGLVRDGQLVQIGMFPKLSSPS